MPLNNNHINLAVKLKSTVVKNKVNLLYTILIFANHFAYGITTNMLGATLVDLRHIFNASLNSISYLPIFYGIGYLIGSQASYLYRRFNRQLLVIIFLILISVTITFLPHYGTLHIALPILVLMGICSGSWDIAVIPWLVDMWPVDNSPLIQSINFLYGCGAIAAPILVSPFLHGEASVGADNKTITVQDRIDSLTYPFATVGIIQLIVPLILFVLYFINRYEKPYQSLKTYDHDDSETDIESKVHHKTVRQQTRIPHRTAKLYLCAFCLACYSTARIGYFTFSSALFQNLEPIHLSASKSAHLLSIVGSTYALSRLCNSFISIKVEPGTILSYHLAMLLTSISIIFVGRDDLGWITFGTVGLGYGFGGLWPSVLCYTERHLGGLTARVCSLYSGLSGSVSIVFPFIMGYYFKSNPLILFYLEFIFITACLALFFSVRIWISRDNHRSATKYSYVQ